MEAGANSTRFCVLVTNLRWRKDPVSANLAPQSRNVRYRTKVFPSGEKGHRKKRLCVYYTSPVSSSGQNSPRSSQNKTDFESSACIDAG
jgi:hypothetical protein